MTEILLGFTGTRESITDAQQKFLRQELTRNVHLHHGVCVGADEAAHWIARKNGASVTLHPPLDERLQMKFSMRDFMWNLAKVTVLPAKPYHERNRDIVDATTALIACPDGPERVRSGTWSTVRYAVRQKKPVTICYPDGTVETR